MNAFPKHLRHRLLALLLGLMAALPAARADDIEIYTNPQLNSLRPPMTILVLDLNLLGICNSVLTPASNSRNPAAPQLCLDLRNNQLLGDLLGGITANPAGLLTNLLTGSGMNASALCNLYGALGLVSPAVPIPAVSLLLRPLLNGVTELSCSTLGFLTGIPLLSSVINGLLPTFVTQLVSGLVNPLLSTAVGRLPATITGLINTTLSGVLNLGQVGLVSLLESILNRLINSKVAIVVSHADRASAAGDPGSACAFGDRASIPTSRRETLGCSNGAYFLVGFTPLVDQGAVTQLLTRVTTLLTNSLTPTNLLNSTTALASTALTNTVSLLPPFQGKEIYTEIAHYLSGDAVYNAPLARWDGLTGLLTRDTSIESGGSYVQPAAQCDTVNVLNIQLTDTQRENESDNELRRYFPTAEQNGMFRFVDVVQAAADPGFRDIRGRKISLRSHFVVQDNLSSLAALASVGINATTYANNLGLLNLGQSLAEFLEPTLRVDASLATASSTVDLANPAAVRGESYFGGFKPAADQRPRWDGNVKKLQRRAVDGSFRFFDVNNRDAVAADGRISAEALTFWTNPAQLGSASVDGRQTALGGAGQRIPGFQFGGGGNPGRSNADNRRKLFYDRYAATTQVPSLAALNPDDATVRSELLASLGAASDAQAQELLLYARGYNVGTTTQSLGAGSGLVGRSWMHGAVLHARPVAINYGAATVGGTPDVRVVYGATDGYLRMIDNATGAERWGFMPRAVMNQQKTLRDDAPTPRFPYGVDGAPAVLIQDRGPNGGPADGRIQSSVSGDRAWIYFGLRRGGSSMYALDATSPDAPRLLWRIGPDGLFNTTGLVANSAAQFAEMALSFSSPQIGRIRIQDGASTTTRSVVIFSAGYNGGRDAANARIGKDLARGSDNRLGSDDARGNAIYMVDAQTGELLWKLRQGTLGYTAASRTYQHPLLADSLPSDSTVLDTDGDGLLDRLYIADTGGRLWRADFPGSDRTAWTATPVASVGRHHQSNVTNDRRFFHAPDYVPFRDESGAYDVILFGSGDREDPFNYSTENFLYAFRDRDVTPGKAAAEIRTVENTLPDHLDFADLTTLCASGAAGCAESADTSTGWRLRLGGAGEKALSQPLTSGGRVFLTSYLPPDPASTSCAPSEGTSRLYGVSLKDSRPIVESLIADTDRDGNKRATDGGAPGLPGEVNTLAASHVAFNLRALEARGRRYYPVYWTERRGDEETPP